MKKKELLARLKDAKMRGQKILDKSEQRELTDEDIACLDKIKAEMDKYKKLLDCIKDIDSPETAEEENDGDGGDNKDEEDEAPKGDPAKKEEKSFRNLGEQMMAVYRASQPAAKIDPRLTTRSASGLNATNPSDGGFLVETQFVKELLKRAYETGILASRCKKIPLTTNANSIRINAIDETSRANGARFGGLQTYWLR